MNGDDPNQDQMGVLPNDSGWSAAASDEERDNARTVPENISAEALAKAGDAPPHARGNDEVRQGARQLRQRRH